MYKIAVSLNNRPAHNGLAVKLTSKSANNKFPSVKFNPLDDYLCNIWDRIEVWV